MLEKYKGGQPIFYNIVMNALNNNKLSHAYLIDVNDNFDYMDIVMSFVKEIICSTISSDEDRKNVCKRIDDGNYIDVKIIEPEGMWIKKEQLLDLQTEFSKEAIEGSKKIYVIKDVDKMNVQTSNSILKFLEEPNDNIVAILVTKNVNLVLPTIMSRCQLIKLFKSDYRDTSLENFEMIFSCDNGDMIINSIIDFIVCLEDIDVDMIIYSKKYWHSVFKDRSLCLIGIELMIYFYYDVLKYKAGGNIKFYKDKKKVVEDIALKNDILSLNYKISVLEKCENEMQRNLNVNLLVDRMIIDMCGDR